jgi:hypothetical protein
MVNLGIDFHELDGWVRVIVEELLVKANGILLANFFFQVEVR